MTGNEGRGHELDPGCGPRAGEPEGRWSLDLLADLHAGVLDPQVEAELRPKAEADPEARAILAALDATVADLAGLPKVRMPDDVAARIHAALAAEAAAAAAARTGHVESPPSTAPVVDITAARRRRRNRWLGWGSGLLAAAAAVFGVVMVALPKEEVGTPIAGGQSVASPPAQEQPASLPPLTLQQEDLERGSAGVPVSELLGARDYGPLENSERLRGCLQGGGISAEPLGVREVRLDGRTAVAALLGTSDFRLRLIVVDPACTADDPKVLSDTVIGER